MAILVGFLGILGFLAIFIGFIAAVITYIVAVSENDKEKKKRLHKIAVWSLLGPILFMVFLMFVWGFYSVISS